MMVLITALTAASLISVVKNVGQIVAGFKSLPAVNQVSHQVVYTKAGNNTPYLQMIFELSPNISANCHIRHIITHIIRSFGRCYRGHLNCIFVCLLIGRTLYTSRD